ncbi:MlaD family protein [Nocardia sp. NPDC047648]|uniref:MlaD family protein n=1 Tax=Nocardia sp. NPDC047648 TaxID=3155625 RepID=UPI0034068DC4
MALYGMPGVAMDPWKSRLTGVLATVLAGVTVVAWCGFRSVRTDDTLRVRIVAERLGDGIVTGSAVRLTGVQVGSVETIDSVDGARVGLTLALDPARLDGLTDAVAVTAAPGNLFGIGELQLGRRPGGAPLRGGSVIELTGAAADRMTDATMGTLLRQLGETTGQVLTPQLAETLRQAAADLKVFTPLLEAVVVLGRTVADGQRYAPSFLVGQYAALLAGTPPFIAGSIQLLDNFDHIEVLRTDRVAFDRAVAAIAHEIFPAAATTMTTARQYLGVYAEMLAPLFTALGHTVDTPQQTSAELSALLARLGAAMPDGPGGPVLNLKLTLSGVPVLSEALLGGTVGAGR